MQRIKILWVRFGREQNYSNEEVVAHGLTDLEEQVYRFGIELGKNFKGTVVPRVKDLSSLVSFTLPNNDVVVTFVVTYNDGAEEVPRY